MKKLGLQSSQVLGSDNAIVLKLDLNRLNTMPFEILRAWMLSELRNFNFATDTCFDTTLQQNCVVNSAHG